MAATCCAVGARKQWQNFGMWIAAICDEEDSLSSPYLRLQAMHAKKEVEEAVLKDEATKKAEAKEARRCRRERRTKEYLDNMESRRLHMSDKELEEDIMRYNSLQATLLDSSESSGEDTFAAVDKATHINGNTNEGHKEIEKQTHEHEGELTCSIQAEDASLEPPARSSTAFEQLLSSMVQNSQEVQGMDPSSRSPDCWSGACSFGELAASVLPGLHESLARALMRRAKDLEAATDSSSAVECEMRISSSEQLEMLISRYQSDTSVNQETELKHANCQESENELLSSMLSEHEKGKLRAVAMINRTIAKRLDAILQAAMNDSATSRVAMALALVDAGGPESITNDVRQCFIGSSRGLSTADVCWALCSEKRRLLVDSMLPSAGAAEGRWSWPELRCFGVGWWLHGKGTEDILTTLLTRLAQSAVKQLRRHNESYRSEFSVSENDKTGTQLVDEAVFWYVLLGTTLAKIRALFKTGILQGDAARAVRGLLEHPKSSESDFMRKNAFRLLQLHRFHLAAAVLALSGSFEEAAGIVAGHMRDLQLATLFGKHSPQVAAPLMKARIKDSSEVQQDPWLHFLLAWHSGDKEEITSCRALHVPSRGDDTMQSELRDGIAEVVLFDDSLRLSQSREGLDHVMDYLCSDTR